MRILVIEPENKPKIQEIDDSLESMQAVVGGLIQTIHPFDDPAVVLVCNDEGKIDGLQANRGLRDETGELYDIVCGTFFVCGAPPDGDSFTGLTDEQIEQYEKRFHTPERFWGVNGRIVCLSLEVD